MSNFIFVFGLIVLVGLMLLLIYDNFDGGFRK